MTKYGIYDKFGPVEIVESEVLAKANASTIYKGTYHKLGFFEVRGVRREIEDRKTLAEK